MAIRSDPVSSKSTLVEGGRYRETCMRYVYLNPVRAVEELGYATHGWRLAKTAA